MWKFVGADTSVRPYELTYPTYQTYQTSLNPTRPVRGPRIAVGCWNAGPVATVIVSAAYEFSRLKPSRKRRSLAALPSFTVFSRRRSHTEILSCLNSLYASEV